MKRQLVKDTVIIVDYIHIYTFYDSMLMNDDDNKRTLLFYRLESGSYTPVVERSGMSWGSFLTLEEAEAFARRHMQGGKVNDVSRQGGCRGILTGYGQGRRGHYVASCGSL